MCYDIRRHEKAAGWCKILDFQACFAQNKTYDLQ
jgi:hypothetical protein